MLKQVQIRPEELSEQAAKWWSGTDEQAWIDEKGDYWIGTGSTDRSKFGTLEQVDAAFCEYQREFAEKDED